MDLEVLGRERGSFVWILRVIVKGFDIESIIEVGFLLF